MKSVKLNGGIPFIEDYKLLLQSDSFYEMETFSDAFLSRNESPLYDYSRRWVSDPLHQWSRQWEYPFTFTELASYVLEHTTKKLSILDAGSGVTFFPFYLKSKINHSDICCCDSDDKWRNVYELVNKIEKLLVRFSTSYLQDMKFQDSSFDCIYCISVLEHTKNYFEIIDEFYRVLRPGGRLIITFDISLDGTGDISTFAAKQLLVDLKSKFTINNQELQIDNLDTIIEKMNIITTTEFKQESELLPWIPPSKFSQIKSLVKQGKFIIYPPPYTIYCLSLTKQII